MILKYIFTICLSIILTSSATVNPTMYTYKTVGDLPIQAAVYVPPINLFEKYPVIFAIHGGGFYCGTATGYALSLRELNEILRRGWAVVSINYRLAPQASISDIVEDVQDAFKWAREDLVKLVPINPDAIAVWGPSAGGGLALISGYKLTPRPQAIISLYPSGANFTILRNYNPNTPISKEHVALANLMRQPLTECDVEININRCKVFAQFVQEGGMPGWMLATSDPNESPENILKILKEHSAVYHVDEHYPPIYLLHGMDDNITSFVQSVQMARQLRDKGIVHKLDLVMNAEHTFDFAADERTWRKHILPLFDFAEKYIAPKINS